VLNSDVGLQAAAVPNAAVVARLKKGTHVAVERLVGDYARVDLGEGRFAFAPMAALKMGTGKDVPKGTPPSVTQTIQHKAPEVTVLQPLAGLATAKDSVTLQANVTDGKALRDAFVFVNEQKVFYRSLANTTGSTKVEANVPLKKGTNVINVVVRVDNELSSRRTLVIHRDGEPETASRHEDSGTRHR
jgi:carboxyl-terminal processing protease